MILQTINDAEIAQNQAEITVEPTPVHEMYYTNLIVDRPILVTIFTFGVCVAISLVALSAFTIVDAIDVSFLILALLILTKMFF
jgi:hypothetical protein